MAKQKRKWQPREMKLVSEYLAQNYPKYECRTRVRLGSYPAALKPELLTGGDRRALGVWRRWADAIVIMPDRLILIEAAIRPNPGDISQLELYERLVPMTPELAEYKDLPIDKVLLFALKDPAMELMARERNIRVVYYHPDWIDEYLAILYPYERRAPLS